MWLPIQHLSNCLNHHVDGVLCVSHISRSQSARVRVFCFFSAQCLLRFALYRVTQFLKTFFAALYMSLWLVQCGSRETPVYGLDLELTSFEVGLEIFNDHVITCEDLFRSKVIELRNVRTSLLNIEYTAPMFGPR